MTGEQAGQIMAVLKAAYPRFSLPPETVRVYLRFLLDLPHQAAQMAVESLICSSTFFPTVAEIREATAQYLPDGQIPSAAEAWQEVMEAVRRHGYSGRPAFSHPAIRQAVDAFGWRDLCMAQVDHVGVDRAHFTRMYETFRVRALDSVLMLPEVRAFARALELAGPTDVPTHP